MTDVLIDTDFLSSTRYGCEAFSGGRRVFLGCSCASCCGLGLCPSEADLSSLWATELINTPCVALALCLVFVAGLSDM